MRLDETYNTETLPESSYDPLPVGWYQVTIAAAELKDTKAGNGKYINLQFTVDGPAYAGRAVFTMLNIRNANPKAEEIGRRQLGEMLRAVGLATLSDTDQLLGMSCEVKLTIEEASGNYDAKNIVKKYKAIGALGDQVAPTLPPHGQTGLPWTRKASAPWLRK